MIRTYSCCFVNNPRSVFVVHIYNLLILNSVSEGYPDREEIWNFLNGKQKGPGGNQDLLVGVTASLLH